MKREFRAAHSSPSLALFVPVFSGSFGHHSKIFLVCVWGKLLGIHSLTLCDKCPLWGGGIPETPLPEQGTFTHFLCFPLHPPALGMPAILHQLIQKGSLGTPTPTFQ